MNKVIGTLAVVAFASSMANAELLKNFKYDGQVEVNAYNVDNADLNKKTDDKKSSVDTRVMLNMGFDLNEDVSAVVSVVKNDRQYGQASQNATGANGILDKVTFEQAYANLKGVIGIDHKLGRQYYGNAGDMVIYYGPLMWPYTAGMTVNAIDGWTGWYKTGNWDFNAIIGKVYQNTGATLAGKNDINIAGVNAKTSVKDVNLNAYYYQSVAKGVAAIPPALGTAQRQDYLDIVGVRANYAIPMVKNLNVAAEYDMNMGKDLNKPAAGYKHQGFAYKLNADYSMDLAGKLAFAGEYVFQSGDEKNNTTDTEFKAISDDYRPGIIIGGQFFGGYGIGGGNFGSGVSVYTLGANWTPSKLEKLNVAVKYYGLSADKKATLNNKNIGTEGDLVATWTHSANVSVNGYYAMFTPEKKNLAGLRHDTESMMGAAFNVKF